MAASPISSLPESQQRELWDGLNYLNLAEIKSFCKRHSIPCTIAVETRDGRRRRTSDDDRKGVILDRLRHFLRTGEVLPETCFPAAVVCFDPLPQKLTATDRLYYGQYDKTNRVMIALLKDLTGGKFRDGAIARILARDLWTRGEAPTFEEFAAAWVEAVREHTAPNPEWAYLSDLAGKRSVGDWKRRRADTAAKVMRILGRIRPR